MKKRRIRIILTDQWRILKRSVTHFGTNRPMELAGTTAYFAVFSMAPIIIIIISVFGYFTGNTTVKDKLFNELNLLIGPESSQLLENAIDNYRIAENSGIGTLIGLVFFLVSATTLFNIMQNSINYIWRVKVKGNLKVSVLMLVRDRLLSFGIILSMGFVLLVSMLVDASISYLKDFISANFSEQLIVFVRLANVVLSIGIIGSLFALIYHFLPDVKVKWSASWYGALFTAVLFMLGRMIIGLVIGTSKLGVVYGAASSFIIILTWVYYASVIFYFGVELTRQFSFHYEHRNIPVKYAVPFEITLLKRNETKETTGKEELPSPDK
ncbi:MAG: YihY/virulence factor BrkB family protein [Prolixibacteraceae bacterium]